MKPFYQDDSVTIYYGDYWKILRCLGVKADVCVTDPPYGETNLQWDKWPNGWPLKLLRAGISQQLWCFGSMRMFLEQAKDFRGWKFAQDIVWEKQNGSGLHNDRFRRVHELALHFYDATADWSNLYKMPVVTMDATKRRVRRQSKPAHWGGISEGVYENEDGGPRLMRSVIFARSCHRRAFHATQKPEEIIYPLLEYSCPKGGLVIDPFMGSGTTLLVAKALGMRAIGIDADRHSCESAAARLRQDVLKI